MESKVSLQIQQPKVAIKDNSVAIKTPFAARAPPRKQPTFPLHRPKGQHFVNGVFNYGNTLTVSPMSGPQKNGLGNYELGLTKSAEIHKRLIERASLEENNIQQPNVHEFTLIQRLKGKRTGGFQGLQTQSAQVSRQSSPVELTAEPRHSVLKYQTGNHRRPRSLDIQHPLERQMQAGGPHGLCINAVGNRSGSLQLLPDNVNSTTKYFNMRAAAEQRNQNFPENLRFALTKMTTAQTPKHFKDQKPDLMKDPHTNSLVSLQYHLATKTNKAKNVQRQASVEILSGGATSNSSSVNNFISAKTFRPIVNKTEAENRNLLRASPSWPPFHENLTWVKMPLALAKMKLVDPSKKFVNKTRRSAPTTPSYLFRSSSLRSANPWSSIDVRRKPILVAKEDRKLAEPQLNKRRQIFNLLNDQRMQTRINKLLPRHKNLREDFIEAMKVTPEDKPADIDADSIMQSAQERQIEEAFFNPDHTVGGNDENFISFEDEGVLTKGSLEYTEEGITPTFDNVMESMQTANEKILIPSTIENSPKPKSTGKRSKTATKTKTLSEDANRSSQAPPPSNSNERLKSLVEAHEHLSKPPKSAKRSSSKKKQASVDVAHVRKTLDDFENREPEQPKPEKTESDEIEALYEKKRQKERLREERANKLLSKKGKKSLSVSSDKSGRSSRKHRQKSAEKTPSKTKGKKLSVEKEGEGATPEKKIAYRPEPEISEQFVEETSSFRPSETDMENGSAFMTLPTFEMEAEDKQVSRKIITSEPKLVKSSSDSKKLNEPEPEPPKVEEPPKKHEKPKKKKPKKHKQHQRRVSSPAVPDMMQAIDEEKLRAELKWKRDFLAEIRAPYYQTTHDFTFSYFQKLKGDGINFNKKTKARKNPPIRRKPITLRKKTAPKTSHFLLPELDETMNNFSGLNIHDHSRYREKRNSQNNDLLRFLEKL